MGRCHRLGHESGGAARAGLDGAAATKAGAGAACTRRAEHLPVRGVERHVGSPARDVLPFGEVRRFVSACWRNG